jgi:ubiquinone/menaquinone biosynthesis C-methylase UbiE
METSETNPVKITFGLIVLNGEPFLRYNLRALYPYAHQIIVVEGACPAAKDVAKTDGHSRDGTIGVIRHMQKAEDPDHKIVFVTAEDEGHPNGFWSEKDEMSQAYAKRATGNYLWQVDVDEFYMPRDMERVIAMLERDPRISAVSFQPRSFWGGLDYQVDGLQLQKSLPEMHRLFAWKPEYTYLTHRVPTVVDEKFRNLRGIKPVTASDMSAKGIYLYHYEYLFPKQVLEKCSYLAHTPWSGGLYNNAMVWVRECFMDIQHPYRMQLDYHYLSWLERFNGDHPPQVNAMITAVKRGEHSGVQMRKTQDIEKLLTDSSYTMGKKMLTHILTAEKKLQKTFGTSEALSIRRSVKTNFNVVKRKLQQRLFPFQSTLKPLYNKEWLSAKLINAWQDPSISILHRETINRQLKLMYNGTSVLEFKALADAIKATKSDPERIIELGCASGFNYEVLCYLLGHQVKYLGVDISNAMIAMAHRYYPHEPFMVGDARNLLLDKGSCDILLLSNLIQHLDVPDKALSEASRVSREWVILHHVPITPSKTTYFIKKEYDLDILETHFTETDLQRMLSQYGFTIQKAMDSGQGHKTFLCKKL